MNETKQSTQKHENAIPRNVFWGTLALAAITLLVSGYFFTLLFKENKTLIIYAGMAIFLSGMVGMVFSILLTIRGRQETGVKIAFYTLLALGAASLGLFRGRAFTAIPAILVISVLTVSSLFPARLRRKYAALTAVGISLMGLIEWIDPSWRIQAAVASAGPIGAIVFATILIGLAVSQFRNYSLRTKLLSAFLLVALVPLGIVFFINNRTTAQNLTESSDAALQGAASETAAALDTFLAERLNDVRTEAQRHILAEYLNLSKSERTGSESEAALGTDLFAIARRDPTFITSVGLLDKNGLSVADTEPSEVGVDKSGRNYFVGVRESQLPYASPVEISGTTGAISMYFSAPVRDSDGKFIGVLRIRYDATVIQSIVKNSAEQANLNSLSVVVFDENHIRLAHNLAPELIFKSVVPLSAENVANLQAEGRLPADKPAEELSTNIQTLEAGLNNFEQQPFFVAEFHDEGEGDEEGTAVRLETQPWLIAAGQDQDIFLAPLTAQTRTNIILALIIASVVALAALWVAQTISNPVLRLTNVARQISGGDIAVQAKVESNDEIGQLATTFNQMTVQLRDFITSLEQRVADRTKALATSTEVSRRISTILEQKELVTEVVNQINNAFGYYHTQIYFYDEARENLVMAGGTGQAGKMMLAQFHKVAAGRGLVGRAAASNQPVLVANTLQNSEWLPNPLLPDTKSETAIPISIGNQVLGVLDIQHNVADGLQQEDVEALRSIANQVAVALQNIRQYENTRKIAADMGVVATVGLATSTITDIDRLLQDVVDLSKESFKLYHAHIYLMNEAENALNLTAGAGEVGRQMVAGKRSIPMDSEQSLVARAARTREGVVVNDVTAVADFLPNPLLPDTRAEMAVPMIANGKVIGVLDVQSETANRFTEVDINIKTTLASQVAIAVQNARNFVQSKQLAERAVAVNTITQKIQSATTIEAALQVTARELGHALGMKPTLVTLEPSRANVDHKSSL